jgi:hypothetical protein
MLTWQSERLETHLTRKKKSKFVLLLLPDRNLRLCLASAAQASTASTRTSNTSLLPGMMYALTVQPAFFKIICLKCS